MNPSTEEKLFKKIHEIVPLLGENTGQADRDGRLPASSIEALREAGFLRLYVPRSLGGLKVDPIITHLRIQEELWCGI